MPIASDPITVPRCATLTVRDVAARLEPAKGVARTRIAAMTAIDRLALLPATPWRRLMIMVPTFPRPIRWDVDYLVAPLPWLTRAVGGGFATDGFPSCALFQTGRRPAASDRHVRWTASPPCVPAARPTAPPGATSGSRSFAHRISMVRGTVRHRGIIDPDSTGSLSALPSGEHPIFRLQVPRSAGHTSHGGIQASIHGKYSDDPMSGPRSAA